MVQPDLSARPRVGARARGCRRRGDAGVVRGPAPGGAQGRRDAGDRGGPGRRTGDPTRRSPPAAPLTGCSGEEEGLEEGTNGRRWVIDPVDGTKLYAEGIPLWTTLIGLEIDGEAVLGVADAPALGQRYHALARRRCVAGEASPPRLGRRHARRGVRGPFGGGGMEPRRPPRSIGGRRRSRARNAEGSATRGATCWSPRGPSRPCSSTSHVTSGIGPRRASSCEEAGGQISTLLGASPAAGDDLLVSNGVMHTP